MTNTVRSVLMGALVALVVAGCGGDDDDDSEQTGSTVADSAVADSARSAGTGTGTDTGDVASEAGPYIDALVANLTEVGGGQLELSQDEAECVAPRWIDVFGVDRLDAASLTPGSIAGDAPLSGLDLSEADGFELYGSFAACGVDVRQRFVDSVATDADASEEAATCLGDEISDELVREFFLSSLHPDELGSAQDEQNLADVQVAIEACGIV